MSSTASQGSSGASRPDDAGMSMVELLVAITVLGTVIVATLGTLGATVIATKTERDHSRAYTWLQSAVGVLQSFPRVGCELATGDGDASGEQKARLAYQGEIRAKVINPPGWGDWQLSIVRPIKVWDGTQYWDPALAPQPCYDDAGFRLQLITIQVVSPDGKIIETVEVVKDG